MRLSHGFSAMRTRPSFTTHFRPSGSSTLVRTEAASESSTSIVTLASGNSAFLSSTMLSPVSRRSALITALTGVSSQCSFRMRDVLTRKGREGDRTPGAHHTFLN
jgi:hypothetical protein